nr:ABC transporter substrate-binding protein [Chromobacterium sp. ASV5]
MRAIHRLLALGLAALPIGGALAAPAHYPSSYRNLERAAADEGRLVIYAATDSAAARPLLKDFQALYPAVKVTYHEMNSAEIHSRFTRENAAGKDSADLLWSPAMDLQVKLVNDGYAARYASPEIPKLPKWAHYRQQAYATTYEPVAIVYNKRLLKPGEIPQTRAELIRIVKADPARFRGKLATYDIERSGAGFNFLTQDYRYSRQAIWELTRALGQAGVQLHTSTGEMMERVAAGDSLIGYNMLGSYAFAKAKKDPAIGYVYPKDYTQIVSRLAIVSKTARHPNAARLWLDYLLSRRGQDVLANQADLFSLRDDVAGPATLSALRGQLGASAQAIEIGPGLLVYLDQAKRREFMRSWRQALRE